MSSGGIGGLKSYADSMLHLYAVDVEEAATALAGQTDYEHPWLIGGRTGAIAVWISDTDIDCENPVDLDDLDLIPIDPLPPYVWYQDMVDFADGISDRAAGERLQRAAGQGSVPALQERALPATSRSDLALARLSGCPRSSAGRGVASGRGPDQRR